MVYRYSTFALQFGVKPYSIPPPTVAPIRLSVPWQVSMPGAPPINVMVVQGLALLTLVKSVEAPRTTTPAVV
jgi:hypothetical protein